MTTVDRLLDKWKGSSQEQVRALIRYAALHVDPMGSFTTLCDKAGFSYNTLNSALVRGSVSKDMALAIEQLVGADVLPADKLLYLRTEEISA